MAEAPVVGGESDIKTRQLIDDGFCIIEDVIDPETIRHTKKVSMDAVSRLSGEALRNAKAPGSLINSDDEPGLAECVGNPRALSYLESMGFEDVRFWKAVIISKPPGGPRLYWHQDCMMWDDPRSYGDISPMIFLMYYLDDTRVENGCLRLLPGTHRTWHELHTMGVAHDYKVNRVEDDTDPRFSDYPGEIDVPMKTGDLIVGDARLFHATHANTSKEHRTVITIWFHPLFSGLQERTQSWVHHQFHKRHSSWPEEALDKIRAVIPDYQGDAEPMEANRNPDQKRFTR